MDSSKTDNADIDSLNFRIAVKGQDDRGGGREVAALFVGGCSLGRAI